MLRSLTGYLLSIVCPLLQEQYELGSQLSQLPNGLRACLLSALRTHHPLLPDAAPMSFAILCLLEWRAKGQGNVWPRFRMWGKLGSHRPPACPMGRHPPFLPAHRLSPPLQTRTAPTSDTSTQARAQRSLNLPLRKVRPWVAGAVESGHVTAAEPGVTGQKRADFCSGGKAVVGWCPVTSRHTQAVLVPGTRSTFVGVRGSGLRLPGKL